MAAMTAEEEPAEVTCMVCKEGYAGSPTQLLGAYCFCRRVPVADCGAEGPPVELVARPGAPAGQVQVGGPARLGKQPRSLHIQWLALSACWPGAGEAQVCSESRRQCKHCSWQRGQACGALCACWRVCQPDTRWAASRGVKLVGAAAGQHCKGNKLS